MSVHAAFSGHSPILLKGVSRQSDNGDVMKKGVVQASDYLGSLIAVHGRHLDIHQNYGISARLLL